MFSGPTARHRHEWLTKGTCAAWLPLCEDGKALTFDAKYYSKNTQENYGRHTVHSAHLYQIFAYVKNKEVTDPGSEVVGMLLYARTGAEIQPNAQWRIGGNEIMVRVLDLGVEFSEIAGQLDQIVGSASSWMQTRERRAGCAGILSQQLIMTLSSLSAARLRELTY